MIPAILLAAALNVAPPQTVDLGPAKLYTLSDDGAQVVGLEVVVAAGTARETPAQNGLAALTAETLLRTKVDGRTLLARITASGGSIGYAVAPDVVRFSIETLPQTEGAVTGYVAQAVAHFNPTPEDVAAARAAIVARITDDERNPLIVGLDMLRASYYTGGAALPPLGTSASVALLSPADVSAFFAAHYRRGGTFATAAGRVDDATSAAARAIVNAFPDGSEAAPKLAVQPFAEQTKRIVTHRDVGVPFVVMGFAAPALGDPDFPAMLVVRALLGDVSARRSATTPTAFERGVDVIYNYDVKPAEFAVAINGGQLDPTAGLTVIETLLKTAVAQPLQESVITRYKSMARGQWGLEAVTLDDRAWQVGAAVAQGADPAAGGGVLAAIDHVTAADVQRVAKTYLRRFTVALVLPRSDQSGS
jgi:predicted Zn-dependent peptidase